MADIDLKTETPDATLPSTGFLFGADSQAAASPSVYSTQAVATTLLGSATLSGATITADAPVLDLAQTWNNAAVTFTGVKFNAAGTSDANSASASLLMDLQVGGARRFRVSKSGSISLGAGGSTDSVSIVAGTGRSILLGGTSQGVSIMGVDEGNNRIGLGTNTAIRGELNLASNRIGWSASDPWSSDTFLGRRAAANLRLGAADAAAPVAQTLSVQSVVAGTTNTAGANLTIAGSQGTGTGAGGSIVFQVAPAGSSGTAQNALATALTIDSTRTATFGNEVKVSGALRAESNFLYLGTNVNGYVRAISNTTWSFFGAVQSATSLGLTSSVSTDADTILYRDAANTLALRNGTNAQTFNVYNTFTASDNFERLRIVAQSGGSVIIGTQKGTAGGTARALELQTDGTTRLTISATSNTITLPAGSSFNSGASGVVSLRYINDPTNAISFFDFYNTAGLATFSIGATNPRMNFGGTTSSFPALKRSSTSLIVRLADDSANAPLESASVKTDAPAGGTSGTWKLGVAATVSPTSPNRTIEVDIGGTIYYIAAKTTND